MEPTTQALIVSPLLVLLVLLLVVSSRRRRREAAAATPAQPVQTQPVPTPEVHAAAAPEPEAPESALDTDTTVEKDTLTQADALVETDTAPGVDALTEAETVVDAEEGAAPRGRSRRRWRGRRGRRDQVDTTDPADGEPQADADLPLQDTDDWVEFDAAEASSALEAALREQLPEAGVLAPVEGATAEQAAAYLRQVSLVVRGLAEHTSEDEHPHRTLARVAAAVERLGAPEGIARPHLPLPSDPLPGALGRGPRRPSHLRELAEPAPAATVHDTSFLTLSAPDADPLPDAMPDSMPDSVPDAAAPTAQLPVVEMRDESPVHEPLLAEAPAYEPQAYEPQAFEAPAFEGPAFETQVFEAPLDPQPTAPAHDDEVVLPVPPPASSAPPARRRRWGR